MTELGGPSPELSRPVDLRQADGRTVMVEATADERRDLARRFAIVAVDRLCAELTLHREGDIVTVAGTLDAAIVQCCAVSAEDLPVIIAEPIRFRFVPLREYRADEELELEADELDEVEFAGTTLDLGEAVAQSLALAIDPFATGPEAEDVRRAGLLGDTVSNPFAVLAKLRSD